MSKAVKGCKCRECKRPIDGQKVAMGCPPVLKGSQWATCRDCRDAPTCQGCFHRLTKAEHKRKTGLCTDCTQTQHALGLVGAA